MEVFATDRDRLAFLLEAKAELHLAAEAMSATGEPEEPAPGTDAATKPAEAESEENAAKDAEQGELPTEKRRSTSPTISAPSRS